MRYAAATLAVIFGLHAGNLYAACQDGTQPSGAKYRICLPDSVSWNRQLVVYAHGYVSPDRPIAIPEDHLKLPDGVSLPDSFTTFGYAFAVTSYRVNGLAILEGQEDLKELTDIFIRLYGKPTNIFLGGVSEGGLIATLSAEKFPGVYDAAIAACGPIGSFAAQINYLADVRNLFDFFFPALLPGTVVNVPADLWKNWDSIYVPAIKSVLAANPVKLRSFLITSLLPAGPDDAATVDNIIAALAYSAMATNDAKAKLKGQPYDNRTRIYLGSYNDLDLNFRIPRYTADPAAVESLKPYETTGKLRMPLTTLHTTGDPVVPWLHEGAYFLKALQNNSIGRLIQIPVVRNGHCNFTVGDVLWSFIVMLGQKALTPPQSLVTELPAAQQQLLPATVR